MKKDALIALVLALSLFVSACGSSSDDYSPKEGMYPLYISGMHVTNMPLVFLDGVNDLPYIEAELMAGLFNLLFRLYDKPTKLAVSTNGPVFTCVRSSEAYKIDTAMTIDFDKDTIRFDDYNIFTMLPCRSTMLDVTSMDFFDAQGRPRLIKRMEPKYLPRFGDPFVFDLAKYGIDLVIRDGKYLIPLQTAADVLFAPAFLASIYFNGKSIIVADDLSKKAPQAIRELYYQGNKGERSAALAKFGYNELCMALDTLYGLKEQHGITSFDSLFQNQGAVSLDVSKSIAPNYSLKSYLTGGNVFNADKAIYHLIGDFLDDNHAKWLNFSYLTGEHDEYAPNGASRERLDDFRATYLAARSQKYPGDVPAYEKVGDTAFITFDAFAMAPDFIKKLSDLDKYYSLPLDQLPDNDTIGLIMKSHDKIINDSDIKNVVIDISVNGGGAADVAVFVAAWFLGEVSVSCQWTMTGAMCSTNYRCDANRDRLFDQNDTLAGKRLFCLVSPYSFSCGNLVPNLFKESQKVAVLGKTSGGGSCVVQFMSSAWGTCFRISGPQRLCYMKNGSYYDIDGGAEPDYAISDPAAYYDRTSLVTYINGLK